MLSKQTKNLISQFLRTSLKVNSRTHTSIPHLAPTTALASNQLSRNITHFPKFLFSTSSKNDSDSKDSQSKSDSNEKSSEKEKSATKRPNPLDLKKKEEKDESSSSVSRTEKADDKKLKSIPIRPIKLPLREGEEDLKVETYVLFSSTTPIIPYSQQSGLIRTGNLGADHISNRLSFFIQNEIGEIYTIGLVLENNVNKTLKKTIGQGAAPPATAGTTGFALEEKNKHKANIVTKAKDYKVRLLEIEFKDNCIFAKAIPYRDTKMTTEEGKVKIPDILNHIKGLTATIRDLVTSEKIDVFNALSFELLDDKKINHQKLDELLCIIVGDFHKLSSYTKESLQNFVESYLEERSLIQRLLMVQKKLEEVRNMLEIISRSVKLDDEQIWNSRDNAKARLSHEYIRSNYFSGESGGNPNAGSRGASTSPNTQTGQSNLTGPAKKFMEKLHLIKDEVSQEKIKKEIERFALQDKVSGEYHKLYTYLDDVFSVPWEKYSEEYWDIDYSSKVLEKHLFGLDKVKERITEMIAVNKLKRVGDNNPDPHSDKRKGFVILLNGPPGIGKTTIAKAIATALKRESRFISFAGVTDPAFVKGHKRTYLDAQPGVFVKELVKARVMNPVFILDEVDKLSKHHQGADPYYALMEILNPEENKNFTDHYLDIKVDFSNVVFILTSNQMLNMLEPLRNRLEIIEVAPYIEQEKLLIAKEYLIPEVLEEHGLDKGNMTLDDETLRRIIKGWCYYESGVRDLKRCLEKIARKHALEILDDYSSETSKANEASDKQKEGASRTVASTSRRTETTSNAEKSPELILDNQNIAFPVKPTKNDTVVDEKESVDKSKDDAKANITSDQQNTDEARQLIELRNQRKLVFDSSLDENDERLKKYLGLPVFDDMYERKNKKLHVGSVNVLTVSSFVGHVLSVECVYDATNPANKGLVTCSGNLQKVLQESLTIARLVALRFIPPETIKEISEKNIHVHFLQGGTPKDGPSAGISVCSALISLALNKPIDSGISMTGELSLNGEIYKIGGVQSKVTASKALDINKIIIPWGNKTDFFELPPMLKEGLEVFFVKEYREVFEILFGDSPKELEGIERFVNGKLVPGKQPTETIAHNQ